MDLLMGFAAGAVVVLGLMYFRGRFSPSSILAKSVGRQPELEGVEHDTPDFEDLEDDGLILTRDMAVLIEEPEDILEKEKREIRKQGRTNFYG